MDTILNHLKKKKRERKKENEREREREYFQLIKKIILIRHKIVYAFDDYLRKQFFTALHIFG
jgi:hypothetical protein